MDNCPVVHVPDSPVEMGHFLRAVFRSNLLLSRQPALPFATIASITRVAHKYQAQEIVDTASGRLADFLIPGPGHWIDAATLSWEKRWELGQKQCGITLEAHDAIGAVNLARLIDKPLMLPVALYLCCLMDPVQLRHGVARADGTQEKLSDEDFARCIGAHPSLATEYHTSVLRSLDERGSLTSSLCPECQKKRGNLLNKYIEDMKWKCISPPSDLLVRVDRRVAKPSILNLWGRESFCTACHDLWFRVLEGECVNMRKCFLKYFALEGLEGWDSK